MSGSRQNPLPNKLPNAPKEYDNSFLDQYSRQLERILNKHEQPDLIKGGGLLLDINSLPTSGYGKRPGTVYRDVNILKIILLGDVFPIVSPITVGRGTITVTP